VNYDIKTQRFACSLDTVEVEKQAICPGGGIGKWINNYMSYIIYKTTNTINGKYYIGVHNNTKDTYLGSGRALLKAIKEYGRENFVRETLEEFETEEQAYLREAQLVDETVVADRNSYNLGKGGKGGPGQSKTATHKENIRKARKKQTNNNGGRKPLTDPDLLYNTVKEHGIKKAAEILDLTLYQCRDRYFRLLKKMRS